MLKDIQNLRLPNKPRHLRRNPVPPSHTHSHKEGTQRLSAILNDYPSSRIVRLTADDAKAYASRTEPAEATADIICWMDLEVEVVIPRGSKAVDLATRVEMSMN